MWVRCSLRVQVRCPTSCTPSQGRTPPGASVPVRCPWLRGGADSQWPPVSRERSGGSRVTMAPCTGKRTFSGRKSGVFLGRPQSLYWRAACCWDSGEPQSTGPGLLGSASFLGLTGYCRTRSCVWCVWSTDTWMKQKQAWLSVQKEKLLSQNTEASCVMSVPRFSGVQQSVCSLGPWLGVPRRCHAGGAGGRVPAWWGPCSPASEPIL